MCVFDNNHRRRQHNRKYFCFICFLFTTAAVCAFILLLIVNELSFIKIFHSLNTIHTTMYYKTIYYIGYTYIAYKYKRSAWMRTRPLHEFFFAVAFFFSLVNNFKIKDNIVRLIN